MKKIITLLCGLIFFTSQSFGQGTPSVKIFANYNAGMGNDFKEFEIKRSYIGYSYKFADDFSAKVTFDVGSNSAGSAYTAFLKIAALNWKASDQLSLDVGMIGTKNFKFMENAWGRRYIEKSALDKYKWASSADAGISGTFKVSDRITLDAQMINGEGYKKTQSDGLFRTGAGVTVKLLDNISCRLFRDNLPTANDTLAEQIITSAALIYKQGNYNIGIEKSIMENEDHGGGFFAVNSGVNREILSMYGSMNVGEFTVFLRRDVVSTNEGDTGIEFLQSGDGTFQIFGIEKQMTKGIKVSLNMQSWQDATLEGEPEDLEARTMFVNLECKF